MNRFDHFTLYKCEYLDQFLFWNARDLEKQFAAFKDYYNGNRVHAALDGELPLSFSGNDVLGKHRRMPVEITLPRSISDTDGSLNCNSPSTRFQIIVVNGKKPLFQLPFSKSPNPSCTPTRTDRDVGVLRVHVQNP